MTVIKRKLYLHIFLGLAAIGLLSTAHAWAAETAPKITTPTVCEIRGQVADLKRVTIGDTPTTLADTETHIYVSVLDRSPRYQKQAGNDPCVRRQERELRTYKLCSPIHIKKGDLINGTEGTNTGPTSPVGCLFDLVVVSRK